MTLEIPSEIRVDAPIEVDASEYYFISTRMAGLVSHRVDESGRYWVKPVKQVSCEYLSEIFKQSRKK